MKCCPVGLGEPVFDKLHADLGKAMLSINAVHGFDYGSGFAGSEMKGKGRHDPCVVPRAVAIVEAMAALVIADHYLRNAAYQA